TVAAVSRLAGLALLAGGLAADGHILRRPLPVAVVGLVALGSVALAVACLRTGAVPIRWVVGDAVVLAGLIWLGEQPWLTGSTQPWRGMFGFATVAVVVYGLPAWPLPAAVGAAALLGLANFGAAAISPAHYPLWNAAEDSLGLLGSTLVFWVIARLLRGCGLALDMQRAATLRRAQTLARERERVRQSQAMPAGILSTLEDVARLDLGPLVGEQVRREVGWLRRVVQTGLPEEEHDLPAGIRTVVAEKVAVGLRVELALPQLLPAPGAARTAVLLGALREALTNVAKHARTARAMVRVRPAGAGIEVLVEDDGRGYDPGRVPAGTGQRGSIIERVAEAGGVASIESAPGRGTRVRIWVPTTEAGTSAGAPARGEAGEA
ncbi:MAG: hypothetical protein J2P15_12810, partial [Micromonosporaceae bacterium]|nr:hypothetical protein [Micromonosporaceae bacterium]